MPFVKEGQIAADPFVRVDDDAEIPARGAIMVTAARLLADGAALTARADPLGVIWPNNREMEELSPHIDKLASIALMFPTFKDGRAYSQARVLRERYRYGGELRATGQVLRDQFLFMLRAGFDAFEVKKDSDAKAFIDTVKRYSVFYQPTGDGRLTAFRRRLMAHRENAR